jgi:hypothetical protein
MGGGGNLPSVAPESAGGVEDPWGEDEPPSVAEPPPLPPRLASLAALEGPLELPSGEPFVHPRAEDLPEVAELVAAGWRVAEPSPMWSFLPAVWPTSLRCWVPDRLPRFSRTTSHRDSTVIVPWTSDVAEDIRRHDVRVLARVGLPPPPPGRIWLLRSPWLSIGVAPVLSMIAVRSQERGGWAMLDRTLVESARELLSWDEERVWSWWPDDRGEVARAWRAEGRTGEDAAALIVARISPGLLAAYRQRGFDEGAALAWTAVLRAEGLEGLQQAVGWTQMGLSPQDVDHDLSKMDPAEVVRWLAEGFDLDVVRAVLGLPLDQAKAWRDAGIPAFEVRPLLHADRTLTPLEARRFDQLGIGPEERRRWVEFGFDADAARRWTDLDVLPNEARVWRAAGHDPATAASLVGDIPAGAPRIPVGNYPWAMTGGVYVSGPGEHLRPGEPPDFTDPQVRGALHHSVDDPPGTRGSHAEEARKRHQRPSA